ncbi:hypothetical protein D9M73_170360 [compost metagenome]
MGGSTSIQRYGHAILHDHCVLKVRIVLMQPGMILRDEICVAGIINELTSKVFRLCPALEPITAFAADGKIPKVQGESWVLSPG